MATSDTACQPRPGIAVAGVTLGLAVLMLAAGCRGDDGAEAPPRPGAEGIRVTDQRGRSLTLPKPPQRIVSIAPSNTELLFALGLGGRVIAVTSRCNHPPEARAKERIGDFKPSIERIAALAPDLVVAVRDLQPDTISKLDEAAVPVLVLDPYTWEDLYQAIEILGEATGAQYDARGLLSDMKSQREQVRGKTQDLPLEQRPKVMVEIGDQPLMVAGRGTFVDQLIQDAGGVNIAGEAQVEWAQFSAEAVVEADPDFILTTIEGDAEKVKGRQGWESVTAIREGRVYEVDPDLLLRPGPRLIQGLQQLLALLHPDLAEAEGIGAER